MDLGLTGKTVLVTAASQGLGRASALELAAEGATVAIAARNSEKLDALAGEVNQRGGRAVVFSIDLADPDAPDNLIGDVSSQLGPLDGAVINGPGPESGPAVSMDDQKWSEAIDTVMMPSIRLIRGISGHMVQNGGGRIVLISTIGVRTVQPNMVLSNSSRLALMGVVKTLSVELAQQGVIINQVAPGPIATDRMDDLFAQESERQGIDLEAAERLWIDEVPMGKMGQPEDVASLVAYLSSARCAYTTGAVIPVDGGKATSY